MPQKSKSRKVLLGKHLFEIRDLALGFLTMRREQSSRSIEYLLTNTVPSWREVESQSPRTICDQIQFVTRRSRSVCLFHFSKARSQLSVRGSYDFSHLW